MTRAGNNASPRDTVTSPQLAGNTLWNVLGQVLPLVVGVFAVPVVVRHLGDARFGVLGLVWAALGYFTVLDLGLGRGTTRFVAQALAAGEVAVASRVATLSVLLHTALGVVGGVVVAGLTPLLVPVLVRAPEPLVREARAAFHLVAVSLPFVLLGAGLRAVLEAAARFDVANLIRIPFSSLTFLVPALAAALGGGLRDIVALLLAVRVLACAVTLAAIPLSVPGMRWSPRGTGVPLAELVRYSGWVGAANLLNPFLHHFDRFLLGALWGVAAVAYYTAPFEVVTRLLILPGATALTLFPAFSTLSAERDARRGAALLKRSGFMLSVLLLLPTIVLIGFGEPLLRLWLGPTYAAHSATALRVLAVGVMVNGLAHVPYGYLQGIGRPDLPTKFLAVELPVYVLAAWWLVGRYGVAGAAGAWTLRVVADAALIFGATYRLAFGGAQAGAPRLAGAAPGGRRRAGSWPWERP